MSDEQMVAIDEDRLLLRTLGIVDEEDQQWLIDHLPCAIPTFREAWNDDTPYQTNGPRAILIACWKGSVAAMIATAARKQALQVENALLKTGVAEAIKAITSLPIDALGTGYTSATGEPYPIRDELLDALLSLLTPLERKQLLEE